MNHYCSSSYCQEGKLCSWLLATEFGKLCESIMLSNIVTTNSGVCINGMVITLSSGYWLTWDGFKVITKVCKNDRYASVTEMIDFLVQKVETKVIMLYETINNIVNVDLDDYSHLQCTHHYTHLHLMQPFTRVDACKCDKNVDISTSIYVQKVSREYSKCAFDYPS